MYQQSIVSGGLASANAYGSALANAGQQAIGQQAEAPRQAEIPDELLRLSRQIEDVSVVASALEDKINPILRPREPSNSPVGAVPSPSHTELGGQLISYTERVIEVRRRLQSILERIEL